MAGAFSRIWNAEGHDGATNDELHIGESLFDVAVLVTVRLTPPVDLVFNRQVHIMPRRIINAMANNEPISGHFILSKSVVFSDLLVSIVPMLLLTKTVVLRLIFSSSRCCSMITILY